MPTGEHPSRQKTPEGKAFLGKCVSHCRDSLPTPCAPAGCYPNTGLGVNLVAPSTFSGKLCSPKAVVGIWTSVGLGFPSVGHQSPHSQARQRGSAGLAPVPAWALGNVTVFYFFTITTSGCPSGAGTGPGVPVWPTYPERTTIAWGLPPTAAREAKPRGLPSLAPTLSTGRNC